jgi:hypothetical protein
LHGLLIYAAVLQARIVNENRETVHTVGGLDPQLEGTVFRSTTMLKFHGGSCLLSAEAIAPAETPHQGQAIRQPKSSGSAAVVRIDHPGSGDQISSVKTAARRKIGARLGLTAILGLPLFAGHE